MTNQTKPNEENETLDNLIDNAKKLPLDSQMVLLMVAKAMRYTQDRINGPDGSGQTDNPSESSPA